MNEDEINALVDSRIAERDAQRERETQRIHDLLNPTNPPRPPLEPLPPELITAFESALDSTKGNPEEATLKIAGWLQRDIITGRPVEPRLSALWESVPWVKDVLHPEIRIGLILNVMRQIQRKRERERAKVAG